MSYEKDITMRMADIVEEGKRLVLEIAGHTEVIEVYKKHNMNGAAWHVEAKVEKLKTESEWLRQEWRRLKTEQDNLPY